jgi:hypothetical protein
MDASPLRGSGQGKEASMRGWMGLALGALLVAGCMTNPQPVQMRPADHNAPPPQAAPMPAATGVSTARMSEVTRVLASDEFQGRAMGTPGEDKTLTYLIQQFHMAGLEPGGENGSWTQTVPMIRTKLQQPTFAVRQGGNSVPLNFPDDVYFTTVRDTDAATIANAPIVFVGYGVNAPERNWDDFKGVDLHGKVALFLVNDPDFEAAAGEPAAGKFGGKAMTFYGRWVYKYEEAARRGAIAALIVHETEAAGYGWNVVKSAGGENYNIVLPAGAQQPVLLQGWIQLPAAEALLKRAGYDFDTLKRQARLANFKPIDLHATFSANTKVELEHLTSHNVIGKISGSTYPNETVSYGGHWDAYGIGPADAQGRTIRPGAADDALGLAAMIEVARLFKGRCCSPPGRPRSAGCSVRNITPSTRSIRWRRWRRT